MTALVPTYCRPDDLQRCLAALQAQSRPADEIIVVVRDTDEATHQMLATLSPSCRSGLRIAMVCVPGHVAALNVGIETATGDIIAFLDDDAAPRPDWLARIVAHFQSDPKVGGVGGRDWVHHPRPDGSRWVEDDSRLVVGRVTWWGRTIGKHHLGVGPAREVDMLKGANMSYRRTAIGNSRFDTRLRGTGAQWRNDMAFGLTIRRAGWKLIYDPAVAVDHYVAPRFDEDIRGTFNELAYTNRAFNETLTLLEHLTAAGRAVHLLVMMLVGNPLFPGLARFVHLLIRRDPNALSRWRAARQGRLAAMACFWGRAQGAGETAAHQDLQRL